MKSAAGSYDGSSAAARRAYAIAVAMSPPESASIARLVYGSGRPPMRAAVAKSARALASSPRA